MAYILANKDGTSAGRPGDTVVTGGGLVHIALDGTKTTTPLPGIGKTGNYNDVVKIMDNLTKPSWIDRGSSGGSSGSGSSSGTPPTEYAPPTTGTTVLDSATNYDNFTAPALTYDYNAALNGNYNYSGAGGTVNMSKIVGYGIVGLVLVAVMDKLIG